jgi:tetratricopeptide (TPR) repeat protein
LIARHFDAAISQLRKTLEMDPGFVLARDYLGIACAKNGMLNEAVVECEKAAIVSANPYAFSALGYVYAISGKKAEARNVLDRLQGLSQQRYVSSRFAAGVCAGLGEKDETFDLLRAAYDDRSLQIGPGIIADPALDSVRSDPRFRDLLRQTGLSNYD